MPRGDRKAKNQALFRQVNERIAETSAAMDASEGPVAQAFICECSRIGCRELVEVPIALYGHVRGAPGLFLVIRGHEDRDEDVVADHGDYLIVAAKPGQATDIAFESA